MGVTGSGREGYFAVDECLVISLNIIGRISTLLTDHKKKE